MGDYFKLVCHEKREYISARQLGAAIKYPAICASDAPNLAVLAMGSCYPNRWPSFVLFGDYETRPVHDDTVREQYEDVTGKLVALWNEAFTDSEDQILYFPNPG